MKDGNELVGGAAPEVVIRTSESYSSQCNFHGAEATDADCLTKHELLEFLNEVLEKERAGERALIPLMAESDEKTLHSTLRSAVLAQGWFCTILLRHIRDLGGTPGPATALFHDRPMTMSGPLERLAFLNQRQASLVRRLRDVLPAVRDGRLYADLKAVLRFHEVSVRRCDRLLMAQRRGSRPERNASKSTYGASL